MSKVENHVSNLDVGDKVVILDGAKKSLREVTYVGETNMKVGSYQFSRDNGLGKSLARGKRIVVATPELISQIEEEKELLDLRQEAEFAVKAFGAKVPEMPLAQLREVMDFITKIVNG